MATTAAQDEYNALFANKDRRANHPEDDTNSSKSSAGSVSPPPRKKSIPLTTAASRARTFLPSLRSHSNTGPKGVIADAQAFSDARKIKRNSSSFSRGRSASPGVTAPYSENLGVNDAHKRLSKLRFEDGVVDDDDLDDDDFMESWRAARLQELSGRENIAGGAAARGRGRVTRGGLLAVDGEGFLEAVDGAKGEDVVVVFIYDDRSDVSASVEDCIRSLARSHTDTRFIKLHYLDAEMEPAGVPAVLAYRGGDKFAGLVPIVDEFGDDEELCPQTVEKLFVKHQIL